MIDIDSAIEQSKNKKNVSDGGSACFDFGDVVLVKYTCPVRYLKNFEHTREKSEEIMEVINKKAHNGVNTPMHLAIKRVVEDDLDVCYVLQQKCPGYNCAKSRKNGVSFDEMCDDMKYVLNIPFEYYQKLISDGFELFEMGYEAKNKNLFYDKESGFWYIDFLENENDYVFDSNDPKKVFHALNYRIPKPIQICSSMEYGSELSKEQKNIKKELEYAIKAKNLLAIKSLLLNFEKYEIFFLLNEEEEYKQYLFNEGVVSRDLTKFEQEDYEVFQELYEIVVKELIDRVVNKKEKFWSIECNSIKNSSNLFNLLDFFKQSKYNIVKREEFEDDYEYDGAVTNLFKSIVLNDLIERIRQMEENETIIDFLNDADEKLSSRKM